MCSHVCGNAGVGQGAKWRLGQHLHCHQHWNDIHFIWTLQWRQGSVRASEITIIYILFVPQLIQRNDNKKHIGSAWLAPCDFLHKWPVMRKALPCHDVIRRYFVASRGKRIVSIDLILILREIAIDNYHDRTQNTWFGGLFCLHKCFITEIHGGDSDKGINRCNTWY